MFHVGDLVRCSIPISSGPFSGAVNTRYYYVVQGFETQPGEEFVLIKRNYLSISIKVKKEMLELYISSKEYDYTKLTKMYLEYYDVMFAYHRVSFQLPFEQIKPISTYNSKIPSSVSGRRYTYMANEPERFGVCNVSATRTVKILYEVRHPRKGEITFYQEHRADKRDDKFYKLNTTHEFLVYRNFAHRSDDLHLAAVIIDKKLGLFVYLNEQYYFIIHYGRNYFEFSSATPKYISIPVDFYTNLFSARYANTPTVIYVNTPINLQADSSSAQTITSADAPAITSADTQANSQAESSSSSSAQINTQPNTPANTQPNTQPAPDDKKECAKYIKYIMRTLKFCSENIDISTTVFNTNEFICEPNVLKIMEDLHRIKTTYDADRDEKSVTRDIESDMISIMQKCVICKELNRSHMVIPCNHLICCSKCIMRIDTTSGKCPICMLEYADIIEVLIS